MCSTGSTGGGAEGAPSAVAVASASARRRARCDTTTRSRRTIKPDIVLEVDEGSDGIWAWSSRWTSSRTVRYSFENEEEHARLQAALGVPLKIVRFNPDPTTANASNLDERTEMLLRHVVETSCSPRPCATWKSSTSCTTTEFASPYPAINTFCDAIATVLRGHPEQFGHRRRLVEPADRGERAPAVLVQRADGSAAAAAAECAPGSRARSARRRGDCARIRATRPGGGDTLEALRTPPAASASRVRRDSLREDGVHARPPRARASQRDAKRRARARRRRRGARRDRRPPGMRTVPPFPQSPHHRHEHARHDVARSRVEVDEKVFDHAREPPRLRRRGRVQLDSATGHRRARLRRPARGSSGPRPPRRRTQKLGVHAAGGGAGPAPPPGTKSGDHERSSSR